MRMNLIEMTMHEFQSTFGAVTRRIDANKGRAKNPNIRSNLFGNHDQINIIILEQI